jgi:genome maintenance exonuclease 1
MPILDLVQHYDLTEVNSNTGRRYITPQGKEYPSVTTVLGKIPKPELDEWKERVGHEEAKRIIRTSTVAGNKLHGACENYLLGKELPYMDRGIRLLFNAIKPELAKIEVVKGIEVPMYSDFLKIAGRADCVAIYEGELTIIDFKNSRREKFAEWIEGYFLQATIYAMMFMQMYRVPVKNIAIFVATWQGQKQIFREPVAKRLDQVVQLMKDYNYMWK